MAKNRNWSEAKMLQVAKIADMKEYADLLNNKEAQKEIGKLLKQNGVNDKRTDKAIKDIIRAQEKAQQIGEKETKKEENKLAKWR